MLLLIWFMLALPVIALPLAVFSVIGDREEEACRRAGTEATTGRRRG